jgi:hypothetical protein
VRHISLAIVALMLAANASAEECRAQTEYEICIARVDDVIKTSVDGFIKISYIVQYKGQRAFSRRHLRAVRSVPVDFAR